jgi:hypothetical protein
MVPLLRLLAVERPLRKVLAAAAPSLLDSGDARDAAGSGFGTHARNHV